jgi:hypothetical protein
LKNAALTQVGYPPHLGMRLEGVERATLRADSAAAQENRTPNFKTNTTIVRHRNIGVSFES